MFEKISTHFVTEIFVHGDIASSVRGNKLFYKSFTIKKTHGIPKANLLSLMTHAGGKDVPL